MLATDYIGISAAISATFAGIVSVLVALRQTGVKAQVAEVHAAVQVSNGHTVGQYVEANDARNAAEDAAKKATP